MAKLIQFGGIIHYKHILHLNGVHMALSMIQSNEIQQVVTEHSLFANQGNVSLGFPKYFVGISSLGLLIQNTLEKTRIPNTTPFSTDESLKEVNLLFQSGKN